ncbi:MAG: NUDIX domain-containing protein [Solirubrobacteraceae bacterium]|nr:NUDIX domain-containing protein [Solirubrobacteraceae bacterium]
MARSGKVRRRFTRSPAVAAAVPVRRRDAGGLEFLLVRTSNGARWTFPKGGIEPGEKAPAAAAREALEEAGVEGRVGRRPLGVYRYAPSRGGAGDVTAFLLRVRRDGLPAEPGRDPTWFGFEAARSRLTEGRDAGYGETMEGILRAAEQAAPRGDSGGPLA